MKIKCPICGNLTTWEENPNRPFCSERCKLMDLGKWAGGDYRIPEKSSDTEEPAELNSGHRGEDTDG